jgi:hypothetical protein
MNTHSFTLHVNVLLHPHILIIDIIIHNGKAVFLAAFTFSPAFLFLLHTFIFIVARSPFLVFPVTGIRIPIHILVMRPVSMFFLFSLLVPRRPMLFLPCVGVHLIGVEVFAEAHLVTMVT